MSTRFWVTVAVLSLMLAGCFAFSAYEPGPGPCDGMSRLKRLERDVGHELPELRRDSGIDPRCW